MLWLVHTLILRGVHEASMINIVTTIAKLVPIFAFITITLFFFNLETSPSIFGDKAVSHG